jgi:hypothetical protein
MKAIPRQAHRLADSAKRRRRTSSSPAQRSACGHPQLATRRLTLVMRCTPFGNQAALPVIAELIHVEGYCQTVREAPMGSALAKIRCGEQHASGAHPASPLVGSRELPDHMRHPPLVQDWPLTQTSTGTALLQESGWSCRPSKQPLQHHQAPGVLVIL